MKLQKELQLAPITDVARARIALSLPVLKGILFALNRDRVTRLGGYEKITLVDLAREYREGSGDCGICFEYAVHDSLQAKSSLIHDRVSNVLNDFCGIKSGAESILFGAEKSGQISLIDTSAAFVETISQKFFLEKLVSPRSCRSSGTLFSKQCAKHQLERLPNSIKGLWKADLFLGSSSEHRWVGSTLKLNKADLVGAAGLRVGVYPEAKPGEGPSRDESNNLILCPLPYDASFMESFYSSFFIVKQFLDADAKVPKPVALPNAADRYVAQLFEERRGYSVIDVIEAMYPLGQAGLTSESVVGPSRADDAAPLDAVAPVPQGSN